MKTHTQILEIVTQRDPVWGAAITAWFTSGTIAAVAVALDANNADAGNARHQLASAMQYYSYVMTFNMG